MNLVSIWEFWILDQEIFRHLNILSKQITSLNVLTYCVQFDESFCREIPGNNSPHLSNCGSEICVIISVFYRYMLLVSRNLISFIILDRLKRLKK